MEKLAAFLVVTAILAYISRASLREPRSHGFYRFFAWECITGLFILTLPVWFRQPWTWHQIISWSLLIVSLILLGFGVRSLLSRGRPAASRPGEPQLLAFEKTTRLVTTGIYRYIRHPLYSSLLLLAWGVFFKDPTLLGSLLVAAATSFLVATARADEKECIRFFGAEYQAYMKGTRRFIPFVF